MSNVFASYDILIGYLQLLESLFLTVPYSFLPLFFLLIKIFILSWVMIILLYFYVLRVIFMSADNVLDLIY